MNARTELADALRAELPESWDVRPSFDPPDELEPDRPCLMLWRDELTPGPTLGTRTHNMAAWLLVPMTDPELLDDELDAAVLQLVTRVDEMSTVDWTKATRGTLQDSFAGYRVELRFYTNKEES